MKNYILFTFLLFVSSFAISQESVDKSKITLERIYTTRDFSAEWFGPYKWYQKGDFYTKLERSTSIKHGVDIVKYSSKTGEKQIVINAGSLVPMGDTIPLSIQDYSWSHDLSKLMIFTNSRRVWRSNTRGDYWIFDTANNSLRQIGKGLPESSLMFAKFSHDDKMIAYVSKNNLYLENVKDGKITQLTFDGNDKIINGTFDWAYEEELKCRDGFRWSSDDRNIAYWQVDASDIKNFLMINNTDSVYSYTIPVQYPKVGYDPSSAKIGIVNLTSKTTKWIPVPGDPKQHFLPRLQWLEGENKIVIQQLNRKQNTNRLWMYDLSTGNVDNFFTDSDKAWIDIDWSDVSQTKWGPTDIVFYNKNKDFLWVSEKDGWRHI